MSKMVAVRLDEKLLAAVDHERHRTKATRARVMHEALALWVEQRRVAEAIRRDQEGLRAAPHPRL